MARKPKSSGSKKVPFGGKNPAGHLMTGGDTDFALPGPYEFE